MTAEEAREAYKRQWDIHVAGVKERAKLEREGKISPERRRQMDKQARIILEAAHERYELIRRPALGLPAY
jgi:hypothetical protein